MPVLQHNHFCGLLGYSQTLIFYETFHKKFNPLRVCYGHVAVAHFPKKIKMKIMKNLLIKVK